MIEAAALACSLGLVADFRDWLRLDEDTAAIARAVLRRASSVHLDHLDYLAVTAASAVWGTPPRRSPGASGA